jgi:calcium channel MID1
VPGNENLNGTELAKKYDDYAKQMYSNFEKVMMQVSCEAESTAKYSLARSCDDCKTAYKRWLCTVGIPRCEDYSSDNRFAVVRNVGAPFPNGTILPDDVRLSDTQMPWNNASRNRFIDEEIAPGPYKEILPCEEICYEVVQACPAVMGFACPRPGWDAFDGSYKRRSDDPDIVSCNYPGESRTRFSAASAVTSRTLLVYIATVAAMSLVAI